MNYEILVSIIAAVCLAAFLIILYVRHIINENTVTAIAGLLESLVDKTGEHNTFFDRLVSYCNTAVDAVQQMVRSGQLPDDNGVRKTAAINMVKNYMDVNGDEISDESNAAIESIIESEVLWTSHQSNES